MINNHRHPKSSSPPPPPPPHSKTFPEPSIFLRLCFLCKTTLLPTKDIYMYKGDRGFCSVECRCTQILMDGEESLEDKDSSLAAAMKVKPTSASSSRHHHRK